MLICCRFSNFYRYGECRHIMTTSVACEEEAETHQSLRLSSPPCMTLFSCRLACDSDIFPVCSTCSTSIAQLGLLVIALHQSSVDDCLRVSHSRRQIAANTLSLSPVHTSNNVEATFDFVAKNGNNVERVYRKISSFRQTRNKLMMFDFVERIVRLVAFDNFASTLLLVWTGL